jgi:maltose O-acetyltransferase
MLCCNIHHKYIWLEGYGENMHSIIFRLQRRLRKPFIKIFLNSKNVTYDSLPLFTGPWPYIKNQGKIMLGACCNFRSFRLRQVFTVRENAELEIGDLSRLNDGVNVYATQSIKIGHHARIADMTYIYDTNSHQVSPEFPIKHAPVIIGDNVWIGAKSLILPGTVIGDHSVIAAGSVVSGNIPPKSLAAGIPARVIKSLNIPDDWLR